ncbi:17651_t:CDS:2, partial [Racocetra persica]
AIIAFVSCFLYKCYIYPLYLSPLHKIPGPPVGNLILGNASLKTKDYGKTFSHLTIQYGGIVKYHFLLNKPYLLITDPKLVQIILEIIGEGSLVIANDDTHKRQKKMLSPSFSFGNIK